nr:thiamine phosphate synthase [Roseimaritima ulvae]
MTAVPPPQPHRPTPQDAPPAAADYGVYRILDASYNRASEGLRTIEDYARFVRNDPALSRHAKQLRHDLAAAFATLPRQHLLSARDTPGDVGTTIQTASEQIRPSAVAVATAAAARCQQALRSIEEYVKCIYPEVAPRIEAIRYQTYTLEAALQGLSQAAERLAGARLYALIEGGESNEALAQTIRTLATAGVDILQLRDKRLDDRTLYERTRAATAEVAAIDTAQRPLLIVNDRADIAAAAGADGVHVGQEELPLAAVRRIVGPDGIVGVSTHNLSQAQQAQRDGADYIGCGPTFTSRTKSFAEFPGLEFLKQVAKQLSLPAFAIGGIDATNVDQVLATGIPRVAVSAAITAAESPPQAAAELKQILSKWSLFAPRT